MQSVNDMALPILPVERPEFHRDPMPYVEQARSQHPWLAKCSAGYIVHGYQGFRDLGVMDDKMQSGFGPVVEFYGAQGTQWARFMDEMLLSHSGPVHKRLRASVAPAFTPRRANQARPLMRKVISELLDEWAPRGEFDFAEFASLFPVAVMCAVLGVSSEPIPRIRTALENQMASLSLNHALRPRFMAGFDALWNFADGLVLEREQRGYCGDDSLLDALIATKNAGELLSQTQTKSHSEPHSKCGTRRSSQGMAVPIGKSCNAVPRLLWGSLRAGRRAAIRGVAPTGHRPTMPAPTRLAQ